MKVVVSEFMDEGALAGFGSQVSVTYDPGLVDDRVELLQQVADADAIIVRNRTQVDQELLQAAPRMKVVGRLGVGLDNIALEACKSRAVEVCPATGANTLSVAEYVIGTMMVLVRGAYESKSDMVGGHWPRGVLGKGGEVHGRVLGLVGFGEIAQAVAQRARALGMEISAYDPYLFGDNPAWFGTTNCSLEDLLETSDVLSIHVPLTPETRNLIDDVAITKMRPEAVLINTARGGIVDEMAVVDALRTDKLGGAALDVFMQEPLSEEVGAKFADTPRLILTPHIAGVTEEGNTRVSFLTVENVSRVLGKG